MDRVHLLGTPPLAPGPGDSRQNFGGSSLRYTDCTSLANSGVVSNCVVPAQRLAHPNIPPTGDLTANPIKTSPGHLLEMNGCLEAFQNTQSAAGLSSALITQAEHSWRDKRRLRSADAGFGS